MTSNHKLGTQVGYSLIELMAAIAISGIVLGVVTSTFISQSKSYYAQEQINEMQQSARAVMDLISREVRLAGYLLTNTGIAAIPYNTSQLQVRTDLNGDGDTIDENEDITYSHDTTSLRVYRNANGGNEVLAENIQGFSFTYLDSDSNPTTTTANIRQILVTITARTAGIDPNYSANGGYRGYTLTSLITPRNLAYGS